MPILSFKEIKPKLCINYKYFITDNFNGKFGECMLFPKNENDIFKLVIGHHEFNIDYHYCTVSRDMEHMCGPKGKMYKKKYTRK